MRFGCGAIMGAAVGFGSMLFVNDSFGSLVVTCVVTSLIFGIAAMRRGDRFWERLRHWVWWWI